jgi:hypothetical protein
MAALSLRRSQRDMSLLDATESSRRKRLIDELSSFRNREAIYRDGSKFSRVRVDEVLSTDEGIVVKISSIPTAGLADIPAASKEIRKSWGDLKTAYELWISPHVSAKYYFERGLVEFLIERLARIADEANDESRFDHIVDWIGQFRKRALADRLMGVLKLFFNGQPFGTVSDHFVGQYLEVHGKIELVTGDEALLAALTRYENWWIDSWGRDNPEPAPLANLQGDWSIETESKWSCPCGIPIVNLARHTVILRCRPTND